MKVKDIMTENFEMIASSDTAVQAAQRMKELDVGVLPVREENNIIGMITDRDIVVRALAENKEAGSVTVKEIMSPEIAHCSADDEVADAVSVMKQRQIRRLVVLGNEGTPVGIVSLGDVAVKDESDELAGDTLESVSKPASPSR